VVSVTNRYGRNLGVLDRPDVLGRKHSKNGKEATGEAIRENTQSQSHVTTDSQPAIAPRRPGFEPVSGHVGFVMDKMELGQIFSQHFRFLCQSFHRLLHTLHHSTSGADTIGQIMADVPSGLSFTPPQEI
jgi:hypothetical protein